MSTLSANVARQLKAARNLLGTDVLFNNRTYRVITEEVAGAKAGAQSLAQSNLGVFVASADSRVWVFSPQDFQPWTEEKPPQEGDYLEWHGLRILLSAVSYEDVGDGTTQILCYGMRKVW